MSVLEMIKRIGRKEENSSMKMKMISCCAEFSAKEQAEACLRGAPAAISPIHIRFMEERGVWAVIAGRFPNDGRETPSWAGAFKELVHQLGGQYFGLSLTPEALT